MENRIVVIVPFHNAENYIKKCIDSLLAQKYSNYTIIFVDDCSIDNSISLIPSKDNIIKISKPQRSYALKNIYDGLMFMELENEDIIIIVDGDDYLIHDEVFSKINNFYFKRECLLTYGQYYMSSGYRGICRGYTEEEFKELRKLDWRASHLKTFKYKLLKEFLKQDPELKAYKDDKENFYTMTYDVALMYPLMEIAGHKRIYFNDQVLYVYRLHSLNDMFVNRNLQRHFEKQIQSKPPFKCMF